MAESRNERLPLCGSRYDQATLSKTRITPAELEKVFEWMKKDKNFLVLVGNPGLGKTYFCASIANYLQHKHPNKSMRYWTEGKLLSRIRTGMDGQGDYFEDLRLLTDDHYVFYDDLGSTGLTDWRKEIVFSMVDLRYESCLPTVITTNLTQGEIAQKLEPRVYSRIFAAENTILNLTGPDWRTEGL